jgi:acyl carrier protein
MDIATELEDFLISDIALGLDSVRKPINRDEDLLRAGVIDSFGIWKIIAFVENRFGIRVTDSDIVPNNFSSITSLKAMIERKLPNPR